MVFQDIAPSLFKIKLSVNVCVPLPFYQKSTEKKNRANTGKGRKNENSPSPQKEVKHLKGSHRHGVTQFEQMLNEKKSKISIN